MATLCLDISNYSDEISPEKVREWAAAGVGLVIAQAFPPHYHQHAEQRRQIAACVKGGMRWDAYIYDYLGDPTWRTACLDGLDRVRHDTGALPGRVWLDQEDVETERGWSSWMRIDAIINSVAYTTEWCHRRGLKAPGLYTAKWWWIPMTANHAGLAWLDLWDADYDGIPDTEQSWEPYGGWTRRAIKQYRGTSEFLGIGGLDLNVLSEEEETDVEPEPSNPCEGLIVALCDVCDRIGDELETETRRRNVRKTVVRGLVAQMRATREQAAGPRP